METKPPYPPFTRESAAQKTRMAEDAWNSRDPDRVVLVYSEDTRWRNRAEFAVGREQVRQFLQRKWAKELDYRLIKELWACADNRIAVRFANIQRCPTWICNGRAILQCAVSSKPLGGNPYTA